MKKINLIGNFLLWIPFIVFLVKYKLTDTIGYFDELFMLPMFIGTILQIPDAIKDLRGDPKCIPLIKRVVALFGMVIFLIVLFIYLQIKY